MAETADDIELDDLSHERETQTNEEDETSFVEDRPGDESTLIIDGSNPVFTRVDDEPSTSEIPNARRDAGDMKRDITYDKKRSLKERLGISINKGDGPNSTIIFDKLNFTFDKNDEVNGATYKCKKILILRGGELKYSTDKTKESLVNEFKELLRKAQNEHQKHTDSDSRKTCRSRSFRKTLWIVLSRT